MRGHRWAPTSLYAFSAASLALVFVGLGVGLIVTARAGAYAWAAGYGVALVVVAAAGGRLVWTVTARRQWVYAVREDALDLAAEADSRRYDVAFLLEQLRLLTRSEPPDILMDDPHVGREYEELRDRALELSVLLEEETSSPGPESESEWSPIVEAPDLYVAAVTLRLRVAELQLAAAGALRDATELAQARRHLQHHRSRGSAG